MTLGRKSAGSRTMLTRAVITIFILFTDDLRPPQRGPLHTLLIFIINHAVAGRYSHSDPKSPNGVGRLSCSDKGRIIFTGIVTLRIMRITKDLAAVKQLQNRMAGTETHLWPATEWIYN